jgi:hypothetical protein
MKTYSLAEVAEMVLPGWVYDGLDDLSHCTNLEDGK